MFRQTLNPKPQTLNPKLVCRGGSSIPQPPPRLNRCDFGSTVSSGAPLTERERDRDREGRGGGGGERERERETTRSRS